VSTPASAVGKSVTDLVAAVSDAPAIADGEALQQRAPGLYRALIGSVTFTLPAGNVADRMRCGGGPAFWPIETFAPTLVPSTAIVATRAVPARAQNDRI